MIYILVILSSHQIVATFNSKKDCLDHLKYWGTGTECRQVKNYDSTNSSMFTRISKNQYPSK
jgi:hypothetical protein